MQASGTLYTITCHGIPITNITYTITLKQAGVCKHHGSRPALGNVTGDLGTITLENYSWKRLKYTIMLKKTNKYQTLLAVCLLTLSACNSNETLTDSPNNQGKTPIELTVGIVGENPSTPRAQTRTVTTTDNPYGQAATAFEPNYQPLYGDEE